MCKKSRKLQLARREVQREDPREEPREGRWEGRWEELMRLPRTRPKILGKWLRCCRSEEGRRGRKMRAAVQRGQVPGALRGE